jgi:hypothetical protein
MVLPLRLMITRGSRRPPQPPALTKSQKMREKCHGVWTAASRRAYMRTEGGTGAAAAEFVPRYRRATLARLLAREGMMGQVADAYTALREQMISRTPSLWKTIKAKLQR